MEPKRLYCSWKVSICPLILGALSAIHLDTINIIKSVPKCGEDAAIGHTESSNYWKIASKTMFECCLGSIRILAVFLGSVLNYSTGKK